MPSDVEVALEAARAGAEVIRAAFGRSGKATFKTSAVDPVTETDKAAESAVLAVIRRWRPNDVTLSEESGGAGWDSGRVWIADPLDGTVNFIHGFPHVAVSVAIWDEGRPLAGAVIDVVRGEEFTAVAGGGAFLDGEPIRVSSQTELVSSLIVTGFPYDRRENADRYARVLARVLSKIQGIRRTGSAALDMCYVACGRFDGYWEYGLEPWDAAASLIAITEAGGTWTGFEGVPYRLGTSGVVATNGLIHAELQAAVGSGE